ncbi:MAG TPA: protease pro-enzyme activation domain-containing protein [Bryobacteraceae bacterium]|jgi:subtilase family serine protease|nr:protease pro-enzyme activation domain-containing protein [Bryobacteraceae bacterium]
MPTSRYLLRFSSPLLSLLLLGTVANAAMLGQLSRRLVTGSISEAKLVTLAGNTRPEVRVSVDQGQVPNNTPLDHMLLHLNRPAETEAAFEAYIDELHDPKSPNYHKWLSAAQVGELYGPNQADVDAVVSWLRSRGFAVNSVFPSGMTIDFSGTAGQITAAFHTQIHKLQFKGAGHIANMSDPEIPAALAPVVAGVVSLHDFRPHKQIKPKRQFTYPTGSVNSNSPLLVVPADLATIYNLKPLFNESITGVGQTIAVLEDSDLYNNNDWTTFRSKFGLTQSGSLSTIHPGSCPDPGADTEYGDDSEATIDAEMATAAAPGAAIQVAACADTATTFGAQIALENIVNSSSRPTVISFSYGECESLNGTASNAAFNSAYQQAVAEGISIFVASGDVGAATCDNDIPSDPEGPGGLYLWAASNGITVNAYASSPYVVAVGGTDFSDTYSNTNNQYWSGSNGATYGSALSYIPEIPWNDTCANPLVSQVFGGTSATYGANGFCNSLNAASYQYYNYIDLAAGGGGPSACATGNVTIAGGGNLGGGATTRGCAGYPKPSWQTGVAGIANDGVRDLPDISLFAGDGVWNHYYVACFSDPYNGYPCGSNPYYWYGAGGTSFGAPIMAGIQALVNQKTGSSQGNPNYHYYQLAALEYAGGGNASCDSNNGNAVNPGCTFYDVTMGNISQPCLGNANCFDSDVSFYQGIANFLGITVTSPTLPDPGAGFPGGALRGAVDPGIYGVLSVSSSSYEPAYPATIGWDFATGLGSVNAYNLANNWGLVTGAAVRTLGSNVVAATGNAQSPDVPARPASAGTGMPTRAGGALEK